MSFQHQQYYYARPLPQPGVYVDHNSPTTWPDDLYTTNNYHKPGFYHWNNYMGFIGYPARVHRNIYKDQRHWPASAEDRKCLQPGC